MEQEIFLREYQPEDVQALASIYYHTIHKINSEHYTQEQVNAWAPLKSLETTGWREKFLKTHPIIATTREKIVGFVEYRSTTLGKYGNRVANLSSHNLVFGKMFRTLNWLQ
ncbi:hypothetical protein EB008_02660 [bacterium]|nr:hypothetical protein [bacterium]